MLTSLVVLFALVVFIVLLRKRKIRNIPPGPRGIPLLGNIFAFMGTNKIEVIENYRRKYGDVYSLNFLGNLLIVISGKVTLKKALVKNSHVFSDRPTSDYLSHAKGCGIAGTSGGKWKEMKFFTLSALKEFGFGKLGMEGKIQEEIKYFLEEIEKKDSCPFEMKFFLQKSVSNVICSLVFGHRFQYDDDRFNNLMEMVRQRFHSANSILLLYLLPLITRFIPRKFSSMKGTDDAIWEIYKLTGEEIKSHEETFDVENLRDYIDVFIKEMKIRKDEPATNFTGTETVASTLLWALVYLVRNPNVQSRVRMEINDAIGQNCLPSYCQLSKLPYTEATLHEIQRLADVAPHSIVHLTSSDSRFMGYDIPKGTTVIPNLHSVLYDETIWNDHQSFNPGRFLDADGKFLREKTDNMIPFSMGQRACIGESLAKMELFLFITAMLQRFNFQPPEGETPPSLDDIYGVTRSPVDFRIRALPCH